MKNRFKNDIVAGIFVLVVVLLLGTGIAVAYSP